MLSVYSALLLKLSSFCKLLPCSQLCRSHSSLCNKKKDDQYSYPNHSNDACLLCELQLSTRLSSKNILNILDDLIWQTIGIEASEIVWTSEVDQHKEVNHMKTWNSFIKWMKITLSSGIRLYQLISFFFRWINFNFAWLNDNLQSPSMCELFITLVAILIIRINIHQDNTSY